MEKSINQKKANDHSSETEFVSSHAIKAFDPIRQESARAEKQKNLSQDSSRNKALQDKSRKEWQFLSPSTLDLSNKYLLHPTSFGYDKNGRLRQLGYPDKVIANIDHLGTKDFLRLVRHINNKTDADLPLPTNSSYGESSSSSKPDHIGIDIESSSKDSMTPLQREGPYGHRS